jgi:cellulose synthase/poly-beta-1,6-N-acetylglucosamine synthase-like glycosyltransferase
LVHSFNRENVRCISLSAFLKEAGPIVAYKKKALSAGIANSSGALIVTTDADCIAPPGWLRHIAAVYEKRQPVMIIAPVDFTCNGSLVQLFQSLDFMTMQGITAAAHYLKAGNMSNGANLAFSRSAFNEVGGYTGIDHMASGDDYLLLMKLQQRFPERIAYLKSQAAIVQTAPQPGWRSFLQQRIRWASKSGKYDDHRMTAILLLVYLFNLSFAVLFAAAFFNPILWQVLAGMFVLKIAVELYFLVPVARFFRKRRQLVLFPFLQPLHIAYIVLAGFLGFFGTYSWKGRKVK